MQTAVLQRSEAEGDKRKEKRERDGTRGQRGTQNGSESINTAPTMSRESYIHEQ
jgi:hypothetical protein